MVVSVTNVFALAILIFFARIIDVSIGTVRIIFVSKGRKNLAPILGFVEVLIWLVAINQIMTNLTSYWLYIFYAGGFAMGNYVGVIIEEKLSIGRVLVRIITQNGASELIKELKSKGYILTVSDAQGRNGNVKIIFTVIYRKKVEEISEIIKRLGPKAFYTIEDIKYAKEMDYEMKVSRKNARLKSLAVKKEK